MNHSSQEISFNEKTESIGVIPNTLLNYAVPARAQLVLILYVGFGIQSMIARLTRAERSSSLDR